MGLNKAMTLKEEEVEWVPWSCFVNKWGYEEGWLDGTIRTWRFCPTTIEEEEELPTCKNE